MSNRKTETSVIRLAEQKERRQTMFMIGSLSVFIIGVIFAAWFTDGRIVSSSIKFLQSLDPLESRNPAANCSNPKNVNTPYCQERRAAVNATWTEMGKTAGGRGAPYALHSY